MVDVSAAVSRKRGGVSRSHVMNHRRHPMAALPVRRGGRNTSVVNPSREFEDIYDRMGQLMNFAFGLTPAVLADMPWVPLADLSETDDAYVVKAELPGVNKDRSTSSSRTGSWSSAARSPSPRAATATATATAAAATAARAAPAGSSSGPLCPVMST